MIQRFLYQSLLNNTITFILKVYFKPGTRLNRLWKLFLSNLPINFHVANGHKPVLSARISGLYVTAEFAVKESVPHA